MKHRKPGRPKKVTLPPQPERYFQHLTDVELGELLVKELASSARAYVDAHGSESMSHDEQESLRADFFEAVNAVQSVASANTLPLNMLLRLMDTFND